MNCRPWSLRDGHRLLARKAPAAAFKSMRRARATSTTSSSGGGNGNDGVRTRDDGCASGGENVDEESTPRRSVEEQQDDFVIALVGLYMPSPSTIQFNQFAFKILLLTMFDCAYGSCRASIFSLLINMIPEGLNLGMVMYESVFQHSRC